MASNSTRPRRSPWLAFRAHASAALVATGLAACGGGDPADADSAAAATEATAGRARIQAAAGTTRDDAFRLLTQATFGPTEAEIQRVVSLGAAGWIDAQIATPPRASHLARWQSDDARIRSSNANGSAGALAVASSFYQQALGHDDQLRQRVAYALSQILVVSTVDLEGKRAASAAAYLDLLSRNAFGNYRQLLEQVALHPAMAQYLSHLKNRPADPATGRVPDQNFARELMQLFSIGLVQLQADGSPRLAGGQPIPTYGIADVEGMSQVMTGFSWGGAASSTFWGSGTVADLTLPLRGYAFYHETAAKQVLGSTLPARTPAQPLTDLRAALDLLAAHPSVGPFVGRQLIQRLVTSQPSPAYVARVSAVWADNGAGVRGDLAAVVRAILLDPEARRAPADGRGGKLREPLLRELAVMRAFGARSASGLALVSLNDDPANGLGQSPLRAPSVFNFYRPGYVPPEGQAGALGMTVPELQTTTETSVAGQVRHLMRLVTTGVGRKGLLDAGTAPDLTLPLSTLSAQAANPATLVDTVCARLLGPAATPALKSALLSGVQALPVPALRADRGNQAAVNAALLARVQLAVLMAASSPEFIVQK